jgi:hypothetical protein
MSLIDFLSRTMKLRTYINNILINYLMKMVREPQLSWMTYLMTSKDNLFKEFKSPRQFFFK